jgi:hypothetical protein
VERSHRSQRGHQFGAYVEEECYDLSCGSVSFGSVRTESSILCGNLAASFNDPPFVSLEVERSPKPDSREVWCCSIEMPADDFDALVTLLVWLREQARMDGVLPPPVK